MNMAMDEITDDVAWEQLNTYKETRISIRSIGYRYMGFSTVGSVVFKILADSRETECGIVGISGERILLAWRTATASGPGVSLTCGPGTWACRSGKRTCAHTVTIKTMTDAIHAILGTGKPSSLFTLVKGFSPL